MALARPQNPATFPAPSHQTAPVVFPHTAAPEHPPKALRRRHSRLRLALSSLLPTESTGPCLSGFAGLRPSAGPAFRWKYGSVKLLRSPRLCCPWFIAAPAKCYLQIQGLYYYVLSHYARQTSGGFTKSLFQIRAASLNGGRPGRRRLGISGSFGVHFYFLPVLYLDEAVSFSGGVGMKKRTLWPAFLLAGAGLLLTPDRAHANVGLPMIFVTFPAMLWALLPVVVI